MQPLTLSETHQLYLVIGGQAATGRLLDLTARLALRGPLLLLDCGNRANPLPVVRELRRLTADPVAALSHIQTARAFTCYQVAVLLAETAGRPVQHPVLIFDLLATFYDESVSYREGLRLLEEALRCLAHIQRRATVAVSARPPPADFPERRYFLELACRQADVLWVEEPPPAPELRQYSLFS